MPYCDACSACVPVRILVDAFRPQPLAEPHRARQSRPRRPRAWSRRPSAEQYSLFRAYIDARHGDGGMAEMSVLDYSLMVEDSVVETSVTEYRLKPDPETGDAPLIGVSLCDRLSDGISMVYSFYDPDQPARSLGTYMILEQVEFARSLGLPFVYLGYWIDGSRKMRYKNRFQPQEHLTSKGWVRTVEAPDAELPEAGKVAVRTSGRISRLGEALWRQAAGLGADAPPIAQIGRE